jgi:hypothetical protein
MTTTATNTEIVTNAETPTNDNTWYENFIKNYDFQSGDILLFQHHYEFKKLSDLLFNAMDFLVSAVTGSKYSHSAIIIKDPSWRPDLKGLFIIESNWEDFKDAEDNEIKIGVELVSFKKLLEENKAAQTKLWYRKLNCTRDTTFVEKLDKAQSIAHNRPYDLILTDWVKAMFHWHWGNVKRNKTFFCSALVSFIYTQIGFLPADTDWTIVSPKMLGTENPKQSLVFVDCVLDKEILLDY